MHIKYCVKVSTQMPRENHRSTRLSRVRPRRTPNSVRGYRFFVARRGRALREEEPA